MLCGSCQTVNPPSSRFCGGCGHSLANRTPVGLLDDEDLFSAERRFLTVVFCDLVGSTALSDRLDPEQIHELIQQYHRTTSEIIARHGGTVAQYLGDGLLVYFGYPRALGNDAERAVQTALEMVEAFRTITPVVALPGDLALEVRVGIHSGPVVTAELGRGDQRDRLALGGTPNIASRLEGLARPNDVLVSAATRALTSRGYQFADLGEQSLKGVREPMRVFRPLHRRPSHPAADTPQAMIGRDSELAHLDRSLDAVADGGARRVRLVGPSGIGKTRLIEAFVARHQDRTRVLSTRCDVDDKQTVLSPLQRLVRREMALVGTDVDTAFTALEDSLGSRSAVAIAAMLRLPRSDGSSWLNGRPEDQKHQIFTALVEWMRVQTTRRPLVFVVEDLQNADPSSREFLRHCEKIMADEEVLFLLSERSDRETVPKDQAGPDMVKLIPLDEASSEALVRSIAQPSAQQLALILSLAQGVPLFLQELARLSSSGLASDISDRLQYVFAPKLDRLGSAKRTAIIAGIIGREFDSSLLGEVIGVDEEQLHADLGLLQDEDVIAPLPEPNHFEFTHALVRDALIANVLRRSVRSLNERVARVLHEQHPNESLRHPERLAKHWNNAGNSEQALPYYLRAAQGARAVFANAEAIALCDDAIVMAVPQIRDLDPTSADVLLEIRQVLADVHALLRQNDAAREQLSAVLQDLPADDVIRRARMHRKIAALGRYDPPHGLLDMQAALGVLGRATGSRPDAWRQEWVQVQFELAITHYARGDVERMEAIAHELEPFVRSHGNPSQQADFANQMLLVDCWRNRFRSTERALRYATEFVEAAERADDLPTLAAACHSYGMIKLHQGAMAEAERSFDRCLELCDRCGYRSAQVRGLMYYAVLRRRQGDLAAAADYSLRGVTLARQAGMRMYEHTYEAMGSWHAYRHRDFATAVRLAQAALQGWADMGARYPFQWIATLPLLAAALAIDDESSVLTCLRDLTSLAQQYLAQELMEAIEQAVAAPGRECFAAVVASAHRTAYL